MKSCELCVLQAGLMANGSDVDLGDGWRVNLFQGASARPRFVMQPTEHATALYELGPRRLAAMGRLMGRVERNLLRSPGVERVYFQIFSETAPGHPHIHVTPRFRGETELGPGLAPTVEAAAGFDATAALQSMARLESTYAAAPVVDRILRAVGTWNRTLSPARLFRAHERPRGRLDDFAPAYLAVSMGVLATLALVLSLPLSSGLHHVLAIVGLVVGCWRLVDIVAFVTSFVLGAGRDRLQHAARSLVMFVLNAVEVLLIGVVGLMGLGQSAGSAWLTVLSMLGPVHSDGSSSWPQVLWVVLISTIGVALLTAVIGLIVGKLAERFVDEDTVNEPQALDGNKDHA